jgi:transcriptional regulator with XRE-family HTH domain
MLTAQQIKKQREYLEMTQKDLANKIGVTQQAVARWDSGKNIPGYDKYLLLLEILGLDGKTKVYDIHNIDTDRHTGLVGYGSSHQWAKEHKDMYVIQLFYGGHIRYWRPKEKEKPRVIEP